MRVSIIIEKINARSGGAERVLVELANELVRRRHKVEIITHEFARGRPFYAVDPEIDLTNLRPARSRRMKIRRALDKVRNRLHRTKVFKFPVGRLIWFSMHGGFWRRLQRHLNKTNPDVAIAFLPPAISALALAQTKVPVYKIGSLHNVPEMDYCNPERWDPNPVDRRRRYALLRRLDHLTVLLPEYRDWFPADLREKIDVLPNKVEPVDPGLVRGSRAKVILSVGRLSQVKRHDILLRAWANLHRDFPEWSLKIFGVGPLEGYLKSLADDLGILDIVQIGAHTDQIETEYLHASLLAHPAKHEGFPLAVSEALAHGLPVVGFSDCTGLNTLVQNGKNGILVESDEENRAGNFENALRSLMLDDDLRRDLAKAAPATVARYAPEYVYDLWEEIVRHR